MEHCMQIQSSQIACGTQLSFGNLPKVSNNLWSCWKDNLLPCRMYWQKQKDYHFHDYRKYFLWVLTHFPQQYLLTNKTFGCFFYVYKIEPRMHICLRNPIMLAIPLRELNLNLKNRDDISKSAIHVFIKAYPTIPLSGGSNLMRRYL